MTSSVVGYYARVYDGPEYTEYAKILVEKRFMCRHATGPSQSSRMGHCLRQAELAAQQWDREYPGKYVEVGAIWEAPSCPLTSDEMKETTSGSVTGPIRVISLTEE